MKKISIYILLALFAFSSCEKYLESEPIAVLTEENFLNDPNAAEEAVNACYDLIFLAEGPSPDGIWMSHNYPQFVGDVLTANSESGKTGDLVAVDDMKKWIADSNNGIIQTLWIKIYWGIYRTNYVIANVPNSSISDELKARYLGEAYFIRGYWYLQAASTFGGGPIITEPIKPEQFGNLERATIHQNYEQAIADFDEAIKLLPTRGQYAAADLGRATKGAAQAFKARSIMYQIGMDIDNSRTWQDVYDAADAVIASGEYSLLQSFAYLFELEYENSVESIFEIQNAEGPYSGNSASGIGSNYAQAFGPDGVWGWAFCAPTQDLVDAYDVNDPRLSSTVYGEVFNNALFYGEAIDYSDEKVMTAYLSRKAALEPSFRPTSDGKNGPKNFIMMRLADVYLMRAEAAYHLGNETQALTDVQKVRERAINSTYCKGYNEGKLDYPASNGKLPQITLGGNLLDAILKERRLELAMEALHYFDLVRTGRYLDELDRIENTATKQDGKTLIYAGVGMRKNCESHSIDGPNGNKIPTLPIPESEVLSWGIAQNPNY